MDKRVELFSRDGISKSQSIFDDVKLRWLNSLYIKELPEDKFLELSKPFFEKSKVYGKFSIEKIAKILQSRIEILSDIPSQIDFLAEIESYDLELFVNKKNKTSIELAKEVLPKIITYIEGMTEFNNQILFDELKQVATEVGIKVGGFFWIMRIAITGMAVTPGGATEMADILGKEETLKRLRFSLSLLA